VLPHIFALPDVAGLDFRPVIAAPSLAGLGNGFTMPHTFLASEDQMDTAKTFLFVVNDAPYGDERPYNALRLARTLPGGWKPFPLYRAYG